MVPLTCLVFGANCQQAAGLSWNIWNTRTPLHVAFYLGFYTDEGLRGTF